MSYVNKSLQKKDHNQLFFHHQKKPVHENYPKESPVQL